MHIYKKGDDYPIKPLSVFPAIPIIVAGIPKAIMQIKTTVIKDTN